jgi:hypothetical protein
MATLATDEFGNFQALLVAFLRVPLELTRDAATGTVTGTFDPPLSAAEQALLSDLFTMAKSRVIGLTPAEWNGMQADISTCRTYLGLASPTAAQSGVALKALIRVVAALFRQ